jgi:hypothetical protein
MLLPDAPREGIVVNLAELRLYYFPPGENQVQVYPQHLGPGLRLHRRNGIIGFEDQHRRGIEMAGNRLQDDHLSPSQRPWRLPGRLGRRLPAASG